MIWNERAADMAKQNESLHLSLRKLKESMKILTADEHELILALFFDNKSEREYAENKGVYHNAIHKKKLRILKKLKMYLEK